MAENTSKNKPDSTIEHYKAVIHALSEATILVAGSGTLLALNPSAVSLLGSNSHTWVGRSLYACLNSSVEDFRQYLLMCSRTKQLLVGAVSLRLGEQHIDLKCKAAALIPKQDDHEATLIVQLFPKYKGNAQFIALDGRIKDLNAQIAKRQRIEVDLRAQKERLQVILQSIGDAVIITDAEGLVTFLNPIAEKLTGWDTQSAWGRSFSEIFHVVHEATRQTIENPIDLVLREKRIVNLANNSILISRAGIELPIADTAAPIVFKGTLEGVVVVFHDVSLKRNFERQLIDRAEKLEEENRQKNAFLAMLAHELRNPLAPISNAVHLLASNANTPMALNILQRQVSYLTQLTNSLLDVSRMTHGKIQIALDETDIRELVAHTCEDFSLQFEKKEISLNVALPPQPVWIMGDRVRLVQVVANLLGNSIKFTPPHGTVSVSLTTHDERAILRVSDTGIGIDPHLVPNLFRPFMQGEQNLARSYGGLGLGLAMVKEILDLHGGNVMAESEGKDRGSRITVQLPLARQKFAHVITDAASSPSTRTILLIEDNVQHAKSLSLLLQSFGNTVHMAVDGVEGIEMAKAVQPDIIICDIGLPKLDGFSVARNLREDERTRAAIMVALSGYGQADFVEQARQAGFDGYYLKPMKIDDIRKLTRMVTAADTQTTRL